MTTTVENIITNERGQEYFDDAEILNIGNHTIFFNDEKLRVVVYKGKSKKPLFNYEFDDHTYYRQWIDEQKLKFQDEFNQKLATKLAKQNLTHTLSKGDVLVFDQNSHLIRFFQVTQVTDQKKVLVREINQLQVKVNEAYGYCSPLLDSFKSKEFEVVVAGEDNFMKVNKYFFLRQLQRKISADLKLYALTLNTSFQPTPYQLNG